MKIIHWEVLDGWSVREPEKDVGTNALKIYMPYSLPECVLMPGDDTLIPTGLWFPGLFRDYQIIPIHHTYPNKDSDVLEKWDGYLRLNIPVFHTSVVIDKSQVFIHIINLGKTELKYRSGNTIAYFCFSPILSLNDEIPED